MGGLIFSENTDSFQCFIDFVAEEYIYIDGEEYFIDSDGNLGKLNSGNDGYSTLFDSKVCIVVNDSFMDTKVFDSVEMYFNDRNESCPLTEHLFRTSASQGRGNSAGIENREGLWRMSIPRAEGSESPRLRDRYLVCTYKFDLHDADNGKFTLSYIKTNFRKSFI